jgi:hypothetical protein
MHRASGESRHWTLVQYLDWPGDRYLVGITDAASAPRLGGQRGWASLHSGADGFRIEHEPGRKVETLLSWLRQESIDNGQVLILVSHRSRVSGSLE